MPCEGGVWSLAQLSFGGVVVGGGNNKLSR